MDRRGGGTRAPHGALMTGPAVARARIFRYDRQVSPTRRVPAVDARTPVFLGSSTAEHPAVNRRVAGSNPARGANPTLELTPFPTWDERKFGTEPYRPVNTLTGWTPGGGQFTRLDDLLGTPGASPDGEPIRHAFRL